GVATSTVVTSLAAGNHVVTAVYGGNADFTTSTGTLSGGQTVNAAGTSTQVGSALNPSIVGQSVEFTATVTATAPGAGTPTGTVTFRDGGTPIGTNTLTSGQTTFTTSSLSVASHTITVVYNGDGNFNTDTSGNLTQTVNKAD